MCTDLGTDKLAADHVWKNHVRFARAADDSPLLQPFCSVLQAYNLYLLLKESNFPPCEKLWGGFVWTLYWFLARPPCELMYIFLGIFTLMSAYPISGAQMSAFLKGIYA